MKKLNRLVVLVLTLVFLQCAVSHAVQDTMKEVVEYAVRVSFIHGKVELLFTQIDKALNRHKADLSAMEDKGERTLLFREKFRSVDSLLQDLDALNEEAARIVPPDFLNGAHIHFLLGVQLKSLGMRHLQMYFMTRSQPYASAGSALLAEGDREFAAFTAMMSQLGRERGAGK